MTFELNRKQKLAIIQYAVRSSKGILEDVDELYGDSYEDLDPEVRKAVDKFVDQCRYTLAGLVATGGI